MWCADEQWRGGEEAGRRGDEETRRRGDEETRRRGDEEAERWSDGEAERWGGEGDGEAKAMGRRRRWGGESDGGCVLASSPPRVLASSPPRILTSSHPHLLPPRILAAALLALLVLLLHGSSLQAEEFNRVGLVVQFGDATIITRCVTFETEQMSGVELLEQSGLAVTIATDPAFGRFVCQIESEGCPADNCLCAYPPNYWRYWWLVDGTWQFAPVGVSSRLLGDGDVDGWSWRADAPPAITFAEICPAMAVNKVYLPLVVTGET